jgi:CysZ protein
MKVKLQELRAEASHGLQALWRGFGMWRTTPRLMLLGAVPAVIVGIVFLAVFIVLMTTLPALTEAVTPFAAGWPSQLRTTTRVVLGVGLVVLAVWGMVMLFAATTLLVGDAFYEKIAEHVENELGDPPPGRDETFWQGFARQTGESLRLAVAGVGLALSMFLIDLLPAVGTVLALSVGLVVGGRLLVVELTGRALEARGFDLDERRRAVAAKRARTGAFGAVAYLMLLTPGLSVVSMPSVVAGATILARDLLAQKKPVDDFSDIIEGTAQVVSETVQPAGGEPTQA